MFPISNWTELDVWQYIAREKLELPSIYYAHAARDRAPQRPARAGRRRSRRCAKAKSPKLAQVRFRTVGDISCTCPVEAMRTIVEKDHRRDGRDRNHGARRDRGWTIRSSEAAMEQRKKQGYF